VNEIAVLAATASFNVIASVSVLPVPRVNMQLVNWFTRPVDGLHTTLPGEVDVATSEIH